MPISIATIRDLNIKAGYLFFEVSLMKKLNAVVNAKTWTNKSETKTYFTSIEDKATIENKRTFTKRVYKVWEFDHSTGKIATVGEADDETGAHSLVSMELIEDHKNA